LELARDKDRKARLTQSTLLALSFLYLTVSRASVSPLTALCHSRIMSITSARQPVAKLQRLQNMVARVVTGTQRSQHITPTLAQLHWLPVRARIEFKVAFLTFKTLTSRQPSYLLELLRFNTPIRQLRSNNHCRLSTTCVKTKFANCAFCHAAPAMWNNLPAHITNDLTISATDFKRKLKTHLYARSFNSSA
jgi:hypothetical protein